MRLSVATLWKLPYSVYCLLGVVTLSILPYSVYCLLVASYEKRDTWCTKLTGTSETLNRHPCDSPSQCSHFWIHLSFWPYLAPVRNFVMISQTVQELWCWQTHRQIDTTENSTISLRFRCTVGKNTHYHTFRTKSRFFLATAAGLLILRCNLYVDKFTSMPLSWTSGDCAFSAVAPHV